MIELLRDLRDDAILLFRQEVQLARTEAAEKGSELGRHVAQLAIGGAIAFAGALALIAALSVGVSVALLAAGLSSTIAWWLGPGIVGALLTIIGMVMVLRGKKQMKEMSLVPVETMASLRENKEWTQHKLTHQ